MKETATETASVHQNKFLEVNYSCKTSHVSYSIADYAGNIVMRDAYECIVNNQIDIHSLPKGLYILCIIDGDSLTKTSFVKT